MVVQAVLWISCKSLESDGSSSSFIVLSSKVSRVVVVQAFYCFQCKSQESSGSPSSFVCTTNGLITPLGLLSNNKEIKTLSICNLNH